MSLNLIRTLLQLAQSDGNISGSEMALIHKIAVSKGLPMFEVEQLVANPQEPHDDLQALSPEDKFEYLYTIILMAKMDARLDEREIEICSRYAEALGYDHQVVQELLEEVKSDADLNQDKEAIREKIRHHLKT